MPLGMLPDITVTVIPDVANGRYLPFTGRDNLTVTRSSIVAIVLSDGIVQKLAMYTPYNVFIGVRQTYPCQLLMHLD